MSSKKTAVPATNTTSSSTEPSQPFDASRILPLPSLKRVFQESLKNKRTRFCFILGAGASVESKIPTGNRLEMTWMNCLQGIEDDYDTPKMDPDEVERLARQLYAEGKLDHTYNEIKTAWEAARSASRQTLPSEYYFDIYKLRFFTDPSSGYYYLERAMEGKEPSIGYHALAHILSNGNLNNLVITTNFDSLMEDALFLYTGKKALTISHEALAEFIKPNIQRPVVAKVHRGLMFDPFNSPDTTDTLMPQWKRILNILFKIYTPIVVGYGGGDSSLMSFLKDADTDLSQGIYWCYLPKYESDTILNAANEEIHVPNQEIRDFIQQKRGFLVQIDGFDSLMVDLGNTLYQTEGENQIIPTNTIKFLQTQCEERINRYQQRWNDLYANEKDNPTVQQLKQEEASEAEKREQENKLTPWDYVRRADDLIRHGHSDDALANYTKAIELDQNNAFLFTLRGNAYVELRQYENAISDLDKAIDLDPTEFLALIFRGDAYAELGQFEKAFSDFNKAIELRPDYPFVFAFRGKAYTKLGQYEKAISDFDRAIELDPTNPLPFTLRAEALRLRNAPGDLSRAEEDERRAKEL